MKLILIEKKRLKIANLIKDLIERTLIIKKLQ